MVRLLIARNLANRKINDKIANNTYRGQGVFCGNNTINLKNLDR